MKQNCLKQSILDKFKPSAILEYMMMVEKHNNRSFFESFENLERERERRVLIGHHFHHTLLPCVLHACTHNNFFFFPIFFFFWSCCTTTTMCSTVSHSTCIYFCFWWVCWVGLVVSYCVWTCLRLRNFGRILKFSLKYLGLSFTNYQTFNFGIEIWILL